MLAGTNEQGNIVAVITTPISLAYTCQSLLRVCGSAVHGLRDGHCQPDDISTVLAHLEDLLPDEFQMVKAVDKKGIQIVP
jgi:hypothetical protein